MNQLQSIETIDGQLVEQTSLNLSDSDLSNEDELILAWLGEKAESTRKTYLNAVKGFFEFGGSIDATFSTIQKYREALSQQYRVSTANKHLSAIKSLICFATELSLRRNLEGKIIPCISAQCQINLSHILSAIA